MQDKRMTGIANFADFTLAEIKEFLIDWVYLTRILFQPTKMIIEGKKMFFDAEHLTALINQLEESNDIWIMAENNQQEASLHLVKGTIFQRLLLAEKTYWQHERLIEDYLTERLIKHGVFANFRAHEEFLYHNVPSLSKRRTFESAKEQEDLPKMKDFNGEIVVDCSKLAGYDFFYQGSFFTACWRMFFGKQYQELIPKRIFLELQQVERIKKVGKGVFIELYKDPYQWQETANLEYQQLFRDQLGVDHFANVNGVGILREPFIEYAYIGSVVQTVQYQNDSFQPTEKSKASYFLTRTYDQLTKQYEEKQMKGVLNAQAYFPWIDNGRKKMMNYKVLQPDLTIDNGLKAYLYYIRQSLEMTTIDDTYQDYTAILRLYVPKHNLAALPIKEIKAALTDVTVKSKNQENDQVTLELKKAEKQLKVIFLNLEILDIFDGNELMEMNY